MKLGKYIQLLLPENETVIIPGFGAFISTYKPAEIDKESGEIKPPSKAVNFNRQIRNNDGLLVATIAEKEGISHFEALQKIEMERENMLYQLDKGEKVILEKIGELQHDEQQNIRFNPYEGENLLLDAFGLENASPLKEITEEESELDDEDKKLKEFVAAINEQPSEKEAVEKEPPSERVKEPEPVLEEKQEGKKNRSWLWFLLILLPLIGVGIFMIRKDNEKIPPSAARNDRPVITDIAPDETELVAPDTIPEDTLKVAAQQEAEAVNLRDSVNQKDQENSGPYLEPDSLKYYLVAGSFKEKENADKFLNQLENEGLNPFHLGKQGNFYIIGLGEYNSEQEAFDAQDEFLAKNPESGVWIYQIE